MKHSEIRVRVATFLLLVLAAVAEPAEAQRCTAPARPGGSCDIDLEIEIPTPVVMHLSVRGMGQGLGSPTLADYERGYREVMGPRVTVHANQPYVVRLEAPLFFAYSGQHAAAAKPASDVRWGTQPGVYPYRLGEGATAVLKGGPGPAVGAPVPSEQLFFKILWDFDEDPPGEYRLDLRFTISSP